MQLAGQLSVQLAVKMAVQLAVLGKLAAQLGVLDLRGRRSVQADCSAKLTG